MKFNKLSAAALAVMLCVLFAGCGIKTAVSINPARYNPSFPASQFSDYKGRQINIVQFINSSDKTEVFAYYSPGMVVSYTSNQAHLGAYFRDCFRQGFRHAGMRVLEDEAFPANIPEFQLTIATLNDMKFEFRATVTRDGQIIMQKFYIIDMEPYKDGDAARLERRAYLMVDKAVTAVLSDPDFKKSWI